MSDQDAARGPVDKAYARAESMLDDEAARAARRARVLGAVAQDAAWAPVAPPKRRVSWVAGGWLAAASVAGVGALLAIQIYRPPASLKAPAPPARAPAAATPAAPVTPSPPAVADEVAQPAPAPAPAPDRPAPVMPPADVVRVAPPPLTLPTPLVRPAAPAAAPPPAAPPAYEGGVEALIVQSQKREESLQPMQRSAPLDSATAEAAPAAPVAQTARLHAAAAAGRLSELTALLAQGTPVDATDSSGETALMKAIRARQAAAAALLRERGASLDRANRAGVSAREMAAAIDDPDLNRALGLEP